jgi:diguanylate cyclase (GGDEF)-like protein
MQIWGKLVGPWWVAISSMLGVAVVFALWELGEDFFGDALHSPEELKYIFRWIVASFVTTMVLSTWAIRRITLERAAHDHELEEINKKLRELAITDGVTGTYNHRYFELTLEREWQKMERLGHMLSCIMIDLDNFKQVNDEYGHPAGDQVLRELAQLVKNDLREIDVLSRYGGEEFVIILFEKPGHLEGLRKTMERLRENIAKHVTRFGEAEIRVTASLGGAMMPGCGATSADELVQIADKMMYDAKLAGKNCVRVCPTAEITQK